MSIYPRSKWTSTGKGGSSVGRDNEVIVHHFYRPDIPDGVGIDYEARVMRSVRMFHVEDRGWSDIGYQWVVFQSGNGYEGRGWFRSGAHTVGHNNTPAICFAIDGDTHVPTDAAWDTARAIIADGVDRGALTADPTISGHTDYSAKSCPGTRTYPLIQQLAEEPDMPLNTEDLAAIRKIVQAEVAKVPGKTWNHRVPNPAVAPDHTSQAAAILAAIRDIVDDPQMVTRVKE